MSKSKAVRCFKITEPLIFEKSCAGRTGFSLPAEKFEVQDSIPKEYLRESLQGMPEVSEPQVVRHFTRLSQFNFGVDTGTYPLGSCTMKYNPKINELVARLVGFTHVHPYFPDKYLQGTLELMYDLEQYLGEIAGMDAVSLQPAAGAHGEFCGMRVVREALEKRGEHRTKVLIPDTAHGTNPASCTVNGYESIEIKSGGRGILTAEDVAKVMTTPNTLGLFEEECAKIAAVVHEKGGFVYCDGANLNALMGVARPGDMGFDVMHYNLHKTFSTPHGGGGPGSGPVGVRGELVKYLPKPRIRKEEGRFVLDYECQDSIGRVRAFFGNYLVMVRAYAYLLELGAQGVLDVTHHAVLNANYVRSKLRGLYDMPFDRTCMHECVVTDHNLKKFHVSNVDVAKGLIDRGFHPPTMSFPINVHGALMIEPTENEAMEDLDLLVEALSEIVQVAETDPESLHTAPHLTHFSRLDEAKAARQLLLTADMLPSEGEAE